MTGLKPTIFSHRFFPAAFTRITVAMLRSGGARSSVVRRPTPSSSAATSGCFTITSVLASRNEQRFRFASLMSLAADDAGMPADPEFRSALVAYLEWGTRLALGNSQPGATVIEHAPIPRWGWGEAPPSQP